MQKINNLQWAFSGDWHGRPSETLFQPLGSEEAPTAIIQMGDSGINFYGENKRQDRYIKTKLQESGNIFYILRGNHDANPLHLSTIKSEYDPNVNGIIFYEPEFPSIRYFSPFGKYYINDYKIAVISGSYSVDKEWRMLNHWTWFEDEQLTSEEMEECEKLLIKKDDNYYDLILSHTCPLSFQPTDLFLKQVDQSKVDNSMERFLEYIKNSIEWGIWTFAHYHTDRWQEPNVRIIYNDIISLEELMRGEV